MNHSELVYLPNMLMVGASGRNAGKTEFSCQVITRFKAKGLVAVKVTAVDRADGVCPRGGRGCGVCASLKGDFDIIEETDVLGGKDTSRLLAAGASRVVWLRVLRSRMKEGVSALQEWIGRDSLCICESNSLRNAVVPGVFVMVEDACGKYKASAASVAFHADCTARSNHEAGSFEFSFDRLRADGGVWGMLEDASAVILAGGRSLRMGSDKSRLAVEGTTMLEHIAGQLKRHFPEVIISAADQESCSSPGLPVAVDRRAGCGPLMGIAEALSCSHNDLNFVTAVDTPDIDMPLVRRMLAAAGKGADIVVPRSIDGSVEPLFGVYSRGVAKVVLDLLDSGERRVRALFDKCKTAFLDLPEGYGIVNLNTQEDYIAYRGRRSM